MDNKKLGTKLNAIWLELRKLPESMEKAVSALLKSSEKIDKQTDDLAGIAKNFALIMEESEKGKTITGTVNVENLYEDIAKALSENAPEPTEFDYAELAKLINKDSVTLTNIKEIAQELKSVLPEVPSKVFLADEKIEVFGKALVKIEGNSANNPVFVQLSDGKKAIDLAEIFKVSLSLPIGGGTATGGDAGTSSPTASYGYCAKSETATHQYLFYEDANDNWYVLRRNLSTEVVDYGKGVGGYQSVYDTPTTAPTPAPTYDTYGATF